jgi:thiopeptide-type bacteriocin biosynthesis protein
MNSSLWRQVTISFSDPARAEDTAVTHLGPLLTTAEANGLITAWFFVRKTPNWRVRYLPVDTTPGARAYLHGRLTELEQARHIVHATEAIYEPEPMPSAVPRAWTSPTDSGTSTADTS